MIRQTFVYHYIIVIIIVIIILISPSQVQDLQQAMIPVEKKCGELSNTVQNLEGEKITLTQAVEHWKQRVTNLTQKYNQEKADDNKTQA